MEPSVSKPWKTASVLSVSETTLVKVNDSSLKDTDEGPLWSKCSESYFTLNLMIYFVLWFVDNKQGGHYEAALWEV